MDVGRPLTVVLRNEVEKKLLGVVIGTTDGTSTTVSLPLIVVVTLTGLMV